MKKFLRRFGAGLLLACMLPLRVLAVRVLIPGGQIAGIRVDSGSVSIAGFDEKLGGPAREAGLQEGDRILKLDGRKTEDAEDIREILSSAGTETEAEILRNGEKRTLTLPVQRTPAGKKLGVYLRQGITGIGTVTYYDPQSGRFGCLGHGVSGEDGSLAPMKTGDLYPAQVISVRIGLAGRPGQLMGALLEQTPEGTLRSNTARGVFGKTERPVRGEPLPVAEESRVHTGPAVIRSTVAGTLVQEYSVEILKIYPGKNGSGRNLLLEITDPELLEATGGIVQGMSGSPILQDGYLVGAVTHVLVSNPEKGYGILIENMLDAAA